MQTEDKLLPCPFCGEYPKFYGATDGSGFEAIDCINDDCQVSPTTDYMNYEDALKAWNTRAAPKVKALRWLKLRELCHVSSPCNNLEYRVIEQGLDFFVTINGERFGSSNSVGLAKSMAQGHFEKLILEALE